MAFKNFLEAVNVFLGLGQVFFESAAKSSFVAAFAILGSALVNCFSALWRSFSS